MIPTPSLKALPKDVILKLACSKATPLSLKQIFTIGKHVLEHKDRKALLIPAQFLHSELPIRLSQSVKMINSEMPCGMGALPSFRRISNRILEDISVLTQMSKPNTVKQEEEFTANLRILLKRHRNNILSVGQGFKELLATTGKRTTDFCGEEFQNFFDQFYTMNLGTRLLIGEHLSLHDEGRNLVQRVSPLAVAEKAARDAKYIFEKHYAYPAPEIKISSKNKRIHTLYVEENLHRTIFEVLKNSLKATYDFHRQKNETLPSVKLIMADGEEDVAFKVSDQGGGIPTSEIPKIWSYVCSSTNASPEIQLSEDVSHYMELPLYGFGHGLPFARLTARYFGGDLSVLSMEGYGTDTYIHLYREDECPENLPKVTKLSEEFEAFVHQLGSPTHSTLEDVDQYPVSKAIV
ncbi:alpha-ketoacid dehydrogenase kinase [Basidiobolus meristosporus CBS 931.73]|uniref:Protein-serine/threonine kinase n=1 Tax=Basidiobolus meristosporus CBS 931.73 TaxID=1314790 RepID=A0A1Y1Y1F6_9FUNG|nr:alpha-ketoacid dehydrogenase kinase [Basidiobolus meristosporus CBS 931.73]|eukprot:ORX91808.1 alpha-ketoacid dehydrogenase kinase [Basidiobolus meristosporus CBS 931.73]